MKTRAIFAICETCAGDVQSHAGGADVDESHDSDSRDDIGLSVTTHDATILCATSAHAARQLLP